MAAIDSIASAVPIAVTGAVAIRLLEGKGRKRKRRRMKKIWSW